MHLEMRLLGLLAPSLVVFVLGPAVSAADRTEATRMVLVELYTSQGCDMCPAAEKMLGALAERDRRIVPIAFHVDYFNDPWKDVFPTRCTASGRWRTTRSTPGPRTPITGCTTHRC